MSIVSSRIKSLQAKRKELSKSRKSFFPALLLTVLLWCLFFFIVLFVNPDTKWALELFFITLFFALVFTLSLLLANTRRGAITALSITLFVLLKYLNVGSLFNLALIISAAIAFEYYFTKTH